MTAFGEQVTGVGALSDPVRRRLYEFVVSQPDAVGRDAAARALDIKRPLAAFHLDKLVDEGLLETEYRRLTGRSGPGAGRPAKLYRRSQRQFDVTLPPREYDLAGRLLAAGVERAAEVGSDPVASVRDVAREVGAALVEGDGVDALLAVLREHGFEPFVSDDRIMLGNCPFHVLSREFTGLVCGMNLALCEGIAEATGVSDAGLAPHLEPHGERCCVVFGATAAEAGP